MLSMIHSFFAGIGPFFLLLGLLIFVHEMGHFLVAKYFNVRVETFSLGFGRKILKYQWGETTYALSLIPLGGYVKMFGDDPSAEIPVTERDRAFLHKPVFQRVAVVLAGPLMNLLFAIVIFTLIGAIGEDVAGPFVGDVKPETAAFAAGFRGGDKIVKVGDDETPTWNHVRRAIERGGERVVDFEVARPGDEAPLHFKASTKIGGNENIFSSNRQVGELPGLTSESRGLVLGITDDQGAAARAGLRTMDLVTQIGDRKVSYWRELEPALEAAARVNPNVEIQVHEVTIEDKPDVTRTVTLEVTPGESSLAKLGIEPAELYILQVAKDSPASKAGVSRGDRVLKVGGQDVNTWEDVLARVKGFDPKDETLPFTFRHEGGERVIAIKPEMSKLMTMKGQEEHRYTIGIVSGMYPVGPDVVHYRVAGVGAMLMNGLTETLHWSEFVVMSLVRLVQGEVSPKNVGGVITIGRVASHSFAAGLSTFLKTMAIISINLFLLNLLPVPVLDGGHLVFYAIEGVKGAPLSLKKMELAQQIGLMLLMFLMVFAFFNDITNLFGGRW